MRAPRSSFRFRRFLCVLAVPCSLALVVACGDDDDDNKTPAAAGAAGSSGGDGATAGTSGTVIGVGNGGSTGQGGEFTGNGNSDGDPKPPDMGGPDLPGEGAGGAIQVGGAAGAN